jgi:hypothetical protein
MSEQVYLIADGRPIDNYVNVKPGEPYRLFPFGKLFKGGKEINITPEYARQFGLPHFKPPIKRGSHDDAAPAAGHIVGLEVRDDGLYAVPEYTDKGNESLDQGDYRYHSPEVIWDGGYLEHPQTGEKIQGPLIVGDALLHTPHLGESAALYSIEEKENIMSENTMPVPEGLLEKFTAWLDRQNKEDEPNDEFNAIQKERDEFAAEIEQLKAEKEQAEAFAAVRAEFETEEFGAAYQGIGEEDGAVEMLSTLNGKQKDWVLQKLRAMSAQINESALLGEKGEDGGDEVTPVEQYTQLTAKYEKEGLSKSEAHNKVVKEHPEVMEAYTKGNK